MTPLEWFIHGVISWFVLSSVYVWGWHNGKKHEQWKQHNASHN